jgi:hypothetical protein
MDKELSDAWKRAPRQRYVRPGRLLYAAHASKGTWKVPLLPEKSVQETFNIVFEKLLQVSQDGAGRLPDQDKSEGNSRGPYFKVRHPSPLMIEVDFVTPIVKYLDVGTLTCNPNPVEDGKMLEISWYNESSGFYPIKHPWCVTLGLLFFWFPFGDRGWYTTFSMRQLKNIAQEQLNVGEIAFTFYRYNPLKY